MDDLSLLCNKAIFWTIKQNFDLVGAVERLYFCPEILKQFYKQFFSNNLIFIDL